MTTTDTGMHHARATVTQPGLHRRGWTVCCSGGGIRSAAYSLGGLQKLRAESFGAHKDDLVIGVSGGAYIAAAITLAGTKLSREESGKKPFDLGSREEERLRNNTRYLAPDGKTITVGLLSLLHGSFVISLIFIAPVFVAAHALGWLFTWAKVLTWADQQGQPAVRVTEWWWWAWPAAAAFACLVAFAIWHRHVGGAKHLTHTQAVGWLAAAAAVLAVAMVAVPFGARWLDEFMLRVPGVVASTAPLTLVALLSTFTALGKSGIGQGQRWAGQLTDMPEAATSLPGMVGARVRRTLLPWLALTVIVLVAVISTLVWAYDGARFGVVASQWVPVAIAAAVVLCGRFVDVNRLSMHDFYRWRLAAGYGGESTPRLSGLQDHRRLVIAATANVNEPGETAGQGAACLTFTPDRVTLWGASGQPVQAATSDMELMAGPSRMSIFDIVALSGAAISPLMGRATRAAFRLPMTVANARLGQWLPSPAVVSNASGYLDSPLRPTEHGRARCQWWLLPWYAMPHPRWALKKRARNDEAKPGDRPTTQTTGKPTSRESGREAFLWAKLLELRREIDADADVHTGNGILCRLKGAWRRLKAQARYRWLQPSLGLLWAESVGHCSYRQTWMYVTDGGHYDNLGLVAALRSSDTISHPLNDRVVVLDASGDPTNHWSTIGRAVALARVDAGVAIDLDPSTMRPDAAQGSKGPSLGRGEVRRPWASGSFEAADDKCRGHLWVCKLGWWRTSSWDICAYASAHANYPCDSTVHQLYDADEFEAYRALGYEAVEDAIQHGQLSLPPL
jgi:hypothetical protein